MPFLTHVDVVDRRKRRTAKDVAEAFTPCMCTQALAVALAVAIEHDMAAGMALATLIARIALTSLIACSGSTQRTSLGQTLEKTTHSLAPPNLRDAHTAGPRPRTDIKRAGPGPRLSTLLSPPSKYRWAPVSSRAGQGQVALTHKSKEAHALKQVGEGRRRRPKSAAAGSRRRQ